MPVLSTLAMLAVAARSNDAVPTPPVPPRFSLASPLPSIPGVMIDGYGTGTGLAQEAARERGLQARVLWIDATANLDRYNSDEKIIALAAQIKAAGFNTVCFDIKPISGQTVYPSKYEPKLTEWKGKTMPADYNPLPTMVQQCHLQGLSILVSMNAFSEGHRIFKVGSGYARPDLQTVLYDTRPMLRAPGGAIELSPMLNAASPTFPTVYTAPERVPAGAFAVALRKNGTVSDVYDRSAIPAPTVVVPPKGTLIAATGDAATFLRTNATPGTSLTFDTEPVFVPISERPEGQIPLMMNPLNPENQEHALSVIREVVSNYNVDGVLYDDRLRYGGINADFSPLTRDRFEDHVGHKLTWPDDVFKFTLNPNLTRGIKPGPYYQAWLDWRAEQIRDYVTRVRASVKAIRPACLFGAYVGSWYGDYPALGHNYASPENEAGFWFNTPDYAKTGTAPLLDLLITGCYYTTATIYDAMSKGTGIGATVEAAGALTNRLVRDETWTYAGISLIDFKDDPEGLQNALQAACASTQGVMVFDLSHDIEPMWPVFAQAFSHAATPPHMIAGLMANIRAKRAQMDLLGKKDRPVIIAAGSSGAGQ